MNSLSLPVNWVTKYKDGNLIRLDFLNLDQIESDCGVYLIYQPGKGDGIDAGRAIRVGQGNIKDRLSAHRRDPDIGAYRVLGELYVTWAPTSAEIMDGAECYLANVFQPLVGERFPLVLPTPITLPFAA